MGRSSDMAIEAEKYLTPEEWEEMERRRLDDEESEYEELLSFRRLYK